MCANGVERVCVTCGFEEQTIQFERSLDGRVHIHCPMSNVTLRAYWYINIESGVTKDRSNLAHHGHMLWPMNISYTKLSCAESTRRDGVFAQSSPFVGRSKNRQGEDEEQEEEMNKNNNKNKSLLLTDEKIKFLLHAHMCAGRTSNSSQAKIYKCIFVEIKY